MKPIILAALLFASPVVAEDILQPSGNWTGMGHQSGETWGMAVQFVPGGARVDYPDLSCGGVWIFDQGSSTIRGTEWLTYGHKACLDGLKLTVNATAYGFRISWIDANGSELAYANLAPEPAKTGKKSN